MQREVTAFVRSHRSVLAGLLLLILLLWNISDGDSGLRSFPKLHNLEAFAAQQNASSVVSGALNVRLYKLLGHCVDRSRRKLSEPVELLDNRRVLKCCAGTEHNERNTWCAHLIFDEEAAVALVSNNISRHEPLACILVCHPKCAPPTIRQI